MNDRQRRNNILARVLLVLAVLVVGGTLYWFTLPLPSDQIVIRGKQRNLDNLKNAAEQANNSRVAAQSATDPLLWTGSVQQIGPQALATVTKLAKANHLKIVAFRPQKPIEAQGVTQIPFSISIDGSYLESMEFVKQLETPTSKLAVSLVQIAAADASTDHVNGTINVVAYMNSSATPAPTKGAPHA